MPQHSENLLAELLEERRARLCRAFWILAAAGAALAAFVGVVG